MVSRPENGWAYGPWGFDSLSFRLPGGMAELERQRVASAQAANSARRFESCCLRLSQSGVVELGRRAVVTREIAGSSPAAGVLHALVVEAGDDAGPSTRRLRVRVPPRVLTIDGRALVDLAVRGGIRSREGEGEEVDPVLPPAPCRRSRPRRGGRHLAVGELATPPALEAGDRRFESCQPDLAR